MTAIDLKKWEAKVKSELRGKAWDSVFNKSTADGIPIPPVYTSMDRVQTSWTAKSTLNWSRVWRLEPGAQNQDILEVLELGVDTLWIRFERTGQKGHRSGWSTTNLEQWKTLTAGVHLSMLKVVVEMGDQADEVKALFDALCPGHPSIHFVSDRIAETVLGAAQASTPESILSSTSLAQLLGATPVQELELHLRAWAMALDANPEDPEGCVRSIQIQLPADAHIFETVAKFRAIRQLWNAFWACCGVAFEPTITAVTSPRMMADVDEYTNILRCTHAATGAILGGCDALCILPFDHRLARSTLEARRMSVITHAILEEESLLGCIQDPMSGSYYVEQLTDAIAEKAWTAFRAWSCTDGRKLLDSELSDRMAQAQQARSQAIATRRLPLTSISEFPNIEAELVSRTTHWSLTSGRLSYDSDVFTDLRRRLMHATPNPSLTILCIGQEAQWTARYHFTLNAFAVGGWNHVKWAISDLSHLEDTLSDLSVDTPVCICAPNEVYTELAATGWTSKRAVYLAGSPKVANALGATPIHLGCDLRALLNALCDAQEVPQ